MKKIKNIISSLLFRNWGLKLFSLILSFILWLVLIPPEKIFSEKTLTAPLEAHNIPPQLELVEKPPSTIDVVIRAPKRLIDKISPENVLAKLNLEGATIYQEEYPLNKEMISLPPGAEVVNVYPNKVQLKLERTKAAVLDIEPTIIGQLKPGLKLEKIEVTPPRIEVRGAESKIRENEKVRTTPIDISEVTQTTEFERDLILPNPDLRLASSSQKVKIKLTILEEGKNGKDEKKGEISTWENCLAQME
ncbi:MAG: YbbR-like domain-containing protein [Candidatus Aminicenantales bacterium]